ncbi:DUF748 domain-containing protein [Larsenimonas rhizosphaerae]|uniref:DUF748 domain-containing protein n=1 Tax=Larsenimonas rhizosphaerae TaxID=2944682 RepID=A0AA42CSW4_9GAMM|nr:DUF748 domain-containing protein [Larsenimonas rhizosphaerae]MCX2522982.1 DUF748 domain-containing protein [Larsenimonas rhizosphaerae]
MHDASESPHHSSARRWWIGGLVLAGVVGLGTLGYIGGTRLAADRLVETLEQRTGRKVSLASLDINPLTATLTLKGFSMAGATADALPVMAARRITINGAWSSLWKNRWILQQVTLISPGLELISTSDGLNVARLFSDSSSGGGKGLEVQDFRVEQGTLGWTTPTAKGSSRTALTHMQLDAHGLDTTTRHPFSLRGKADWKSGVFKGHGKMGFLPWQTSLWLEADSVPVTVLRGWASAVMGVLPSSGVFSSTVHFEDGARTGDSNAGGIVLSGRADVSDLALTPPSRETPLIRVGSMKMDRLRYQQKAGQLAIGSIVVDDPWLMMTIAEDGTTTLSELTPSSSSPEEQDASGPSTASGASSTGESSSGMHITVSKVGWNQGTVALRDHHLKETFSADLVNLEGQITDVDSQEEAPLTFSMTGQVNSRAPLRLDGQVALFDTPMSGNMNLHIARMPISIFAPYIKAFGGYAVKRGQVSADMHYQLNGKTIRSDNTILLRKLELGEPVGKPPSFPIKTAIALLEGDDGVVSLNVPFTLTPDKAAVDVSAVIWQAIRKGLSQVLTSPFDALAALGGDSDQADSPSTASRRARTGEGPASIYAAIGHAQEASLSRNGTKLSIRFGHDEATLNDAKARRLAGWAEGLSRRSRLSVVIRPGLAGNESGGEALLDQRAEMLEALLTRHGVKPEQIQVRKAGSPPSTTTLTLEAL